MTDNIKSAIAITALDQIRIRLRLVGSNLTPAEQECLRVAEYNLANLRPSHRYNRVGGAPEDEDLYVVKPILPDK